MDRSLQYIKMCFKAWPDLKENYQPAKGDFYKCSCKSCRDTDRIFMINDYDYDYVTNRNLKNVYEAYTEMVKNSGCGGFGAFWALWDDDGFFIIWKQDQLQGIKGGEPTYVLIKFYNWFCDQFSPLWEESQLHECKFQTMEQLWLAFVMKERFNKVWNGEDWIKEK